MHVFQAILSRRSVRAYLPHPLEREKLEQILLAGTYAPSGGNNQSTHFLVLENPQAIDRLRRTAVAALAEMTIQEGMYARLITTIQQARREGKKLRLHLRRAGVRPAGQQTGLRQRHG